MDSSIEYDHDDNIDTRLTKTQRLEIAYAETLRNADIIQKDEAARRLRLRILMLENENDELHEQLAIADDRLDVIEQEAGELRAELNEAGESVARHENESRNHMREIGILKAEVSSMNNISSDSAKILTEKLSLARELATMKPELEHLRSQASYQKTLLAEKLSLERQVSTLEVELETEKRAASKRAAQKTQNHEREAELQQQIDTLTKDLAKEKRTKDKARKEAEAELQSQVDVLLKDLNKERRDNEKDRQELESELQRQIDALRKDLAKSKREKGQASQDVETELRAQVDELQKSLAREQKEREKARKEAESDFQSQLEDLRKELVLEKRGKVTAAKETDLLTQIDDLERSLAREKRERAKDRKDADAELQQQVEDLQKQLAQEKREREKAKKEGEKDTKSAVNKEALLESKLDQFRTKLRSTKEHLKECQTELAQARAANSKLPSKSHGEGSTNNPRKRAATEMTTEFNIGTPDGVADRRKKPTAKRGRMDQSILGEKSMFSITPFLNKTVNLALDTPEKDTEEAAEVDDEVEQQLEVADNADVGPETEAKPTLAVKPAPKPRRRKKTTADTEEGNVLGVAKPAAKNKKLPPKKQGAVGTLEMVTEEADENEEPIDAPVAAETKFIEPAKKAKPAKVQLKPADAEEPKMKNRKVLGGSSKTLFDDDDAEATKRPAKVTLCAPRLLAKGGFAGPKGGLKGGLANASAFGAFSPLKKDKRGVGASFLG